MAAYALFCFMLQLASDLPADVTLPSGGKELNPMEMPWSEGFHLQHLTFLISKTSKGKTKLILQIYSPTASSIRSTSKPGQEHSALH